MMNLFRRFTTHPADRSYPVSPADLARVMRGGNEPLPPLEPSWLIVLDGLIPACDPGPTFEPQCLMTRACTVSMSTIGRGRRPAKETL